MEALFFQILEMSLSASWLVLAVVLLRFVLKKAPKSIHCILWAMVALRLICPSLPESQASLIPDSKPITSVVLAEQGNPQNVDADQTVQLPSNLPQAVGPSQNGRKSVEWGAVLSVVWLIGAVAMAGYGVVSYLLLRRKVAPSIKEDGVWLCDNVFSPFILGIFRPRIYLPSSLPDDCRDSVLTHEQAHLRRKDHWWKPLGFVLLSIHWFNPVMWLAYILLCRDIESACDERVVKAMDAQARKRYSEALLFCSMPRRYIAVCPLAFGEQGVKGRIKSVLRYKKPTVWIILVTIVAIAVLAVCFLTNPTNNQDETDIDNFPYQAPKNAEKVTVTEINRLEAIVPQYFGVNDWKGLEVYVWDEEGTLWCGLMGGTNRRKTQQEIDELVGVSLESMATILETYKNSSAAIVLPVGASAHWDGVADGPPRDDPVGWWIYNQLGLLKPTLTNYVVEDKTDTLTIKIRYTTYIYEPTDERLTADHLDLPLSKGVRYVVPDDLTLDFSYSLMLPSLYTIKDSDISRLAVSPFKGSEPIVYELVSTVIDQ